MDNNPKNQELCRFDKNNHLEDWYKFTEYNHWVVLRNDELELWAVADTSDKYGYTVGKYFWWHCGDKGAYPITGAILFDFDSPRGWDWGKFDINVAVVDYLYNYTHLHK